MKPDVWDASDDRIADAQRRGKWDGQTKKDSDTSDWIQDICSGLAPSKPTKASRRYEALFGVDDIIDSDYDGSDYDGNPTDSECDDEYPEPEPREFPQQCDKWDSQPKKDPDASDCTKNKSICSGVTPPDSFLRSLAVAFFGVGDIIDSAYDYSPTEDRESDNEYPEPEPWDLPQE